MKTKQIIIMVLITIILTSLFFKTINAWSFVYNPLYLLYYLFVYLYSAPATTEGSLHSPVHAFEIYDLRARRPR